MTALIDSSRVVSADGTNLTVSSVGVGRDLIIIGGALSTAQDYLPLARALAGSHRVHVLERRGRGASGPQGESYSIERECEDLLAVQSATGATQVFGHSYGALVALESAVRSPVLSQLALWEPGVSIGGNLPLAWIARYRELLNDADTRGAFAWMVARRPRARTPQKSGVLVRARHPSYRHP
jgi:pimeloyl-ACP methyl ester carboxylesterase